MRPPVPSAVGLRPATPAIRPRGPRAVSKAPRASRPAPTPRPHRSPSHTCMRTARVNLLLTSPAHSLGYQGVRGRFVVARAGENQQRDGGAELLYSIDPPYDPPEATHGREDEVRAGTGRD